MKKKRRGYNERVIEIEHGSFTPLLMSATCGMGRECKKFYSCLAEMISVKRGTGYNITVAWITFSLIKSIGICLRGSRSKFFNDSLKQPISSDAYVSESFLNV